MCYLLSDNNILSVKNIVLGLWRLTLFQLYRGGLFYPLLLRMQFLVEFVFLDIQFFMCMYCTSLFVLFVLSIVLSVLLRFVDLTSPLAFSNSLIGGGNRSTRRKGPTCHMSLTNFITYCYIEYTSPTRFVLFLFAIVLSALL